MGSKFTVEYWSIFDKDEIGDPLYKYFLWWQGEDMSQALIELSKAKEKYPNCVKLTWR